MSKFVKKRRLEKVRGIRPSEEQKQFLISYLEENVYFALDKFPTADGAKQRETQWKDLSDQLNAMGGAFKDSRKWKKFLTDWRLNAREKYSAIKDPKNKNKCNKTLTELEERLLKVMESQTADDDPQPVQVEVDYEEIKDSKNNKCTKTLKELEEGLLKVMESQIIDDDPQPVQVEVDYEDIEVIPVEDIEEEQKMIQLEEIDFEQTSSSTFESEPQYSFKKNRSKTKSMNIKHIFKLEKQKVDLEKEKVELKKKELEIRKYELKIKKIDLKEKLVIKQKLDEILSILNNK